MTSTRISPVTTLVRGGRPPTPLGHEKPVPCMEQMQRTGSRIDNGSGGGDVTFSEESIHNTHAVALATQAIGILMEIELIQKTTTHTQRKVCIVSLSLEKHD